MWRGAEEVDGDAGGCGIDLEAHGDFARVAGDAVAVEKVFGAECAGGHGAQLGAHQALGVIEQLVDEGVESVLAVFFREFEDALLADAACTDLRIEIAFALVGRADV